MAKTVEEWLAEGNTIKEWGGEGDTLVVKLHGFEWARCSGWPEWRCIRTGTLGRRRLGSTKLLLLPIVCSMKGCDTYATVVRGGECWCAEHAEEGSDE